MQENKTAVEMMDDVIREYDLFIAVACFVFGLMLGWGLFLIVFYAQTIQKKEALMLYVQTVENEKAQVLER